MLQKYIKLLKFLMPEGFFSLWQATLMVVSSLLDVFDEFLNGLSVVVLCSVNGKIDVMGLRQILYRLLVVSVVIIEMSHGVVQIGDFKVLAAED